MRNLNLGPFWLLLAGVSVMGLLGTAAVQGVALTDLTEVMRLIPTVATIDGLAYAVFAKWLWRWRALQGWLVPFPDLNGTWTGSILSEWTDESGRRAKPIPVMLTIEQRFAGMSCVMRTAEMESRSYAESLSVDPNDQVKRLCYTYTSRPKQALRDRSTPHDGTIVFSLTGTPVDRLEGEYWTQRGTRGTVSLRFATRDRLDRMSEDA